jgi:hypothetical protein
MFSTMNGSSKWWKESQAPMTGFNPLMREIVGRHSWPAIMRGIQASDYSLRVERSSSTNIIDFPKEGQLNCSINSLSNCRIRRRLHNNCDHFGKREETNLPYILYY